MQGHARAQYKLGLLYLRGQGVIQSSESAYAWWSVAASNGHEEAQKYKDSAQQQMTPKQIATGQGIAKQIWAEFYTKVINDIETKLSFRKRWAFKLNIFSRINPSKWKLLKWLLISSAGLIINIPISYYIMQYNNIKCHGRKSPWHLCLSVIL